MTIAQPLTEADRARAADRRACIAMLRHHPAQADPAWRRRLAASLRRSGVASARAAPSPSGELALDALRATVEALCETTHDLPPRAIEPFGIDCEGATARPMLADILREVAAGAGVTILEIQAAGRQRRITRARHEYFWRAATETLHSLPAIGRHCGGRDHTTVLHGIHAHCIRSGARLPRGMMPSNRVARRLAEGRA